MKHRQLVTGTHSVERPKTRWQRRVGRFAAGPCVVLSLLIGSLAACGLDGPATEGPTPMYGSATTPEQSQPQEADPTQSGDAGSETEAASTPVTEPSGSEQGDQQELTDEAVKVFREYQKAEIGMLTQDKSPRAPAWLKKYGTGKFYTDMLGVIAKHNEATYRLEEDAPSKIVSSVRPVASPGDKGVVMIESCTDFTRTQVVEKSTGKPIKKGALIFQQAKMKRTYKTIKIFESKSDVIDKCPFLD